MAITTDELRQRIEVAVAARADRYIGLADEIWGHAETGFQEHQSSAAQQRILRDEGFRVTPGIAGLPTAFVAEFGSGGPVIGLLGEFDALPGLSQQAGESRENPVSPGQAGHGCGHHLLGTGAALAAVVAARVLTDLGIDGTLRYYACPAEEGGGGKAFMARAGAFDGLDAAFSWHPGMFSSVHTNRTNAFQQVRVCFRGRASHAALTPERGRSALDAAELMNVGVNYLREHTQDGERLHYAYRDAGGVAANVVQARAELAYIIRSAGIDGLRLLSDRVRDVARGAALMTGTEVDFSIESGMSPYRPNLALTEVMHDWFTAFGPPVFDGADRHAAARFLRDACDGGNAPLDDGIRPFVPEIGQSLGSTDVGDVSAVAPVAQIWVAAYARSTTFHSWQMVAQGKNGAAHKAMLQAAKVLAASAVEAVRRPDLIVRAQAEFRAEVGPGGYECPIPAEIFPPV